MAENLLENLGDMIALPPLPPAKLRRFDHQQTAASGWIIVKEKKVEEKEEEEEDNDNDDDDEPSSDTISEGEDLGEIIVPSTPKSKMKKKPEEKVCQPDDEVVMQTPIDKLNRVPTRRSQILADALKISEERRAQEKRKRSSAAVLPHAKMTQLRKSSGSSIPSSSSISASAPQRTRAARVNLRERFAMTDRLNNKESNSPSAAAAAAASQIASPKTVPNIVLEKRIIERYRKRIEKVRQTARKSNKNEIFYGRCTSRRNLFDDSSTDEETERVATRSAACIQKNRSGRSVQTSRVYMAHALLNVYNKDPLNPPKPPKDAPFKLHRLIRPASKTDKKRLSKFKLRLAREKSGSASALVKSGTPSEGSEAASSSQSLKAKSESPEGNTKKVSENSSSSSPNSSASLFKEPGPKKTSRKSSSASKVPETDSSSSNGKSKKSISRSPRKSSNSSNGHKSNASKISENSDANGVSSNEKSDESSNGTVDFVLKPGEDSGSADNPKRKVRKTSSDSSGNKGGNVREKSGNSAELCDKTEKGEEKMDVS